MKTTFSPRLVRSTLLLSLGLALSGAQAALPTVTVITHFTGSQAGGGNGAMPSGSLNEAADGYLYGRTAFGGGTNDDIRDIGGNYGGNGTSFYRVRNDGSDFSVVERKSPMLPASTSNWLSASDGWLYAPSNISSGAVMRYRPGAAAGWSVFGPSGLMARASSVTESAGRLILGSNSNITPFRALAADGSVTNLVLPGYFDGSTPIFMLSDSSGTIYGYFSEGGGNGRGALFRLSADGALLERLITFEDFQIGGYANGPMRPLALLGDYIYGTTRLGVLNGGVLWRIRKDAPPELDENLDFECIVEGTRTPQECGRQVEILHIFGTSPALGGMYPDSLVAGSDGHLYGITQGGLTLEGEPASGAIFRYRVAQAEGEENVLEILHTFSNELPLPARNNVYYVNDAALNSTINLGGNAGGHQVTALMQASNGQFFGLTENGGSYGWGTLFRFEPGNEVAPGSALTPVSAHVILGINQLNAANNHYTLARGGYINLYWRGVYASGCTASSSDPDSGWNGPKAQEGSQFDTVERVNADKVGTWTYTLSCLPQSSELTEPVSATVTLEVLPERAEQENVGDGGGSLPLPVITLLALLGWRARTVTAASRHPRP